MDKLKEYFKDWLNSHMFLKDEIEYYIISYIWNKYIRPTFRASTYHISWNTRVC